MAQQLTGEVKNGVVVFDEGATQLPEGTRCQVIPMVQESAHECDSDPLSETRSWLLEMAREAEANAPPMPSDLARHHDHYAHGKPKP